MKLARYKVMYFDNDPLLMAWFEMTPPVDYKTAKILQAYIADTFETRIEFSHSI